MRKELPITLKNILLLIFLLLLTSGATYIVTEIGQILKEEQIEDTVIAKYSKKGLYLYPRFEIHVENSETPSMVSKEQFESITVGDQVSGYMETEDSFAMKKDIHVQLMLGIPILVFLYFVLFLWISGLLKSATFIKNRKNLYGVMKVTMNSSVMAILIMYLIAGFIFTSLIITNGFHKLNKGNLTETEATVLGGDWNNIRSHRGGSYTTYELFLLYTDDKDDIHITKKAVTGPTYNTYQSGDTLPLLYRNNSVYDTFVQAQGMKEIWPVYMNLFIFLIGGYLLSLFFIIRHWRKKFQSKHSQHEMGAIHN